MTPVAFIFPGQGAQFVGMGKDFYDSSPVAKEIFDKAESILGIDLTHVMFEGPQETLKTTAYAQPAIFSMSVAALEALKASPKYQQMTPQFVCGLSLGEYSALYASGALSFEETLKLLKKRSELMEAACRENSGKMAAILGLDKEQIVAICKQTGAEVANFNSPQQTVITGFADKVDAACKKFEEAGAKGVVPLAVAGAFHSSLMQSAQEKFQEALAGVALTEAAIPLVANVTASGATAPEDIKTNLSDQITSSVQWVATVQYIAQEGVSDFLEIGPGKVLKGLVRRIDKTLKVQNIEKIEDIDGLEIAGG